MTLVRPKNQIIRTTNLFYDLVEIRLTHYMRFKAEEQEGGLIKLTSSDENMKFYITPETFARDFEETQPDKKRKKRRKA